MQTMSCEAVCTQSLKRRIMAAYLRVGVITAPHGIHGQVKVYPTTDDVRRFTQLDHCYVETKSGRKTLHPEDVHFFKNLVIIQFREFSSIEDAMPYKGGDLLIDRDQAIPLGEGEYYIADLIDLKVQTEDGTVLGVLQDVMETGANDVYIVGRPDGKDLLIPAIPDCILDIDLQEGVITVHLLDGLLNL